MTIRIYRLQIYTSCGLKIDTLYHSNREGCTDHTLGHSNRKGTGSLQGLGMALHTYIVSMDR